MSREPNKFKPGDIVRVIGDRSKNWIRPGLPVRITRTTSSSITHVEALDGGDPSAKNCSPWVHDYDCELDVFLNAAHQAVRDA